MVGVPMQGFLIVRANPLAGPTPGAPEPVHCQPGAGGCVGSLGIGAVAGCSGLGEPVGFPALQIPPGAGLFQDGLMGLNTPGGNT